MNHVTMLNAFAEAHAFATLMLWKCLVLGRPVPPTPLHQHRTHDKGNSAEFCILPQLFNLLTTWLFLNHINESKYHGRMIQFKMKTVKPQTGTPWTEAYWHSSNTLCQLQGQVQHPWILNTKKNPYHPLPINLECAVIALDAQWKLFGCSSNSPVMLHGCVLNSPRIPLQFTSINLYFHNFYPQVYL